MRIKKFIVLASAITLIGAMMHTSQAATPVNIGPRSCSPGEFVGTSATAYGSIIVHGFYARNGNHQRYTFTRPVGANGNSKWKSNKLSTIVHAIDTYVEANGYVTEKYAYCQWVGMGVYSNQPSETDK